MQSYVYQYIVKIIQDILLLAHPEANSCSLHISGTFPRGRCWGCERTWLFLHPLSRRRRFLFLSKKKSYVPLARVNYADGLSTRSRKYTSGWSTTPLRSIAWRCILAGQSKGLSKKIHINQMGQRGKYHFWIKHSLLCNLLKFR